MLFVYVYVYMFVYCYRFTPFLLWQFFYMAKFAASFRSSSNSLTPQKHMKTQKSVKT